MDSAQKYLNICCKKILFYRRFLDLTVLKGQNTKKPTTIAKSMPGRIKTKHPFISDFHFLAVSETAHPKQSYFDFCLIHAIWTALRMSELVLNVKYLLSLSFLTAAEFYNLGHIQGIIRVH